VEAYQPNITFYIPQESQIQMDLSRIVDLGITPDQINAWITAAQKN
jgi:hypothetical protein